MEQKNFSFDLRAGHRTCVPLKNNTAIAFSAAGGALRIVFSLDDKETANTVAQCICFVLGDRLASLGFGNLAFNSCSCPAPAEGFLSHNLKKAFDWWFGFDCDTGWVVCGTGSVPGKHILLAQLLPRASWTHVSFSSEDEPTKLVVKEIGKLPSIHASAKKFNKFGGLERFVGVTTVSPLPTASPLQQAMVIIQNLIRENPRLQPYYGLLPPASFHITTLSLHALPGRQYDKEKREWEAKFSQARETVKQARRLLPPTLTFTALSITLRGAVELQPDEATAKALSRWRKVVGRDYSHPYHATFAYNLYPLSSLESQAALAIVERVALAILRSLGPVEVSPPDFCRFQDMGAFPPDN